MARHAGRTVRRQMGDEIGQKKRLDRFIFFAFALGYGFGEALVKEDAIFGMCLTENAWKSIGEHRVSALLI